MKKAKQVLAIVGIVLLVALYVSTLVFAIIDNPKTYTYHCDSGDVMGDGRIPSHCKKRRQRELISLSSFFLFSST